MSVADRLVAIPRREWSALRDLYRQDWPRNFLGFQLVDTFISFAEQQPDIRNLNIFCVNGEWQEDGTFVAVHLHQYYVNTRNTSTTRLSIAVSLIETITNSDILSIENRHRSSVDNILASRKISPPFEKISKLFFLPHEKATALDIACPAGITLAPLRTEHAAIVNAAWPLGEASTLIALQSYIELNPSVGAFDANRTLIAWCLRNVAGLIIALQVTKGHEGRGIGSLVIRALTRKLGDMGHNVSCNVLPDNINSTKLFRKLGYQIIGTNHFLFNLLSNRNTL